MLDYVRVINYLLLLLLLLLLIIIIIIIIIGAMGVDVQYTLHCNCS